MILLMDNFLEQQVVGKSRNSAIKTSNGEEHKNTSKRNNINPDLTSLQNFARVNLPALPSCPLFSQASLKLPTKPASLMLGARKESRNREERNMKRSKSTKKQSVTESSRIQRTTDYQYCRTEAGTNETLLTSSSKWVGEPDLNIAVKLKRTFNENGNDLQICVQTNF